MSKMANIGASGACCEFTVVSLRHRVISCYCRVFIFILTTLLRDSRPLAGYKQVVWDVADPSGRAF